MKERSLLFLEIAKACQSQLNLPNIELAESLSDAVWLSKRLAVAGIDWAENDFDEEPLSDPEGNGELPIANAKIDSDVQPNHNNADIDSRSGSESLSSGTGDAYADYESSVANIPGRRVMFPGVPPLQGAREYERAWRPFAKRVPDWHGTQFDERATADQIAATLGTVWSVATKPKMDRRWKGVAIFERSPTMRFWQNTLDAFYKTMWRTSAFNRLQLAYVDGFKESPPLCKNQTLTHTIDLQSIANETEDERVFFFTDFRSNSWLNGSTLELVRSWHSTTNVVIVHMMSEMHWLHSALRHFELTEEPCSHPQPRANKGRIPIFSFAPQTLSNWVNWSTGVSGSLVTMMSLNPKRPFEKVIPVAREQRTEEATKERADLLYQRFIQFGSEPAQMLARSLASAPLLLPVIRLIQRCELPESTSSHLSEILYSGLVERRSKADNSTDPDTIEYDFLPGVRDKLLNNSSRQRIDRVLHLNWEYMQSRFGNGINFNAIIANPSQAERFTAFAIDSEVAPFARVGGQILQRLGGKQAEAGSKILNRLFTSRTPQPMSRMDRLRMEYEWLKAELEDGTNIAKGTNFHELVSRPLDRYVPSLSIESGTWEKDWSEIRKRLERLKELSVSVSMSQIHVPSVTEPISSILTDFDQGKLFAGFSGLSRELSQLIIADASNAAIYHMRDVNGVPMQNSAGEPVTLRLGLFRQYTVWSTHQKTDHSMHKFFEELRAVTLLASKMLRKIPARVAGRIWSRWPEGFATKHFDNDSLWYDAVWEILSNLDSRSNNMERFILYREPSGNEAKLALDGSGLCQRLPSDIPFDLFCKIPNQLGYPSYFEVLFPNFVSASLEAVSWIESHATSKIKTKSVFILHGQDSAEHIRRCFELSEDFRAAGYEPCFDRDMKSRKWLSWARDASERAERILVILSQDLYSKNQALKSSGERKKLTNEVLVLEAILSSENRRKVWVVLLSEAALDWRLDELMEFPHIILEESSRNSRVLEGIIEWDLTKINRGLMRDSKKTDLPKNESTTLAHRHRVYLSYSYLDDEYRRELRRILKEDVEIRDHFFDDLVLVSHFWRLVLA